ncbi:hypothetical protein LguiB_007288 [Lonicera macranthoides]
MAISKALLIASFFVFVIAIHRVQATETTHMTSNSVSASTIIPKIDCGEACETRCTLSSRPRLCKRACGTCCARCNCVPLGTSGNIDNCPCYAQMTTHDNKRKCP